MSINFQSPRMEDTAHQGALGLAGLLTNVLCNTGEVTHSGLSYMDYLESNPSFPKPQFCHI